LDGERPSNDGGRYRKRIAQTSQRLSHAGVTTVKSVGGSEDDILGVRARVASGALAGPSLLTTGAAFCAPGSHPATTVYAQNPWIRYRATVETDSPERAREAVRRLAGKKVDAVKVIHQGRCQHGSPYFFKLESLGLNVQILKLEKAVLGAIIDETHRHGLKATVHTVDADAAVEALEAGADGLEHGVMEHRLKDDRVVELLLRNRASYVPTLCLIRFEENTGEIRYANLKQIADAGVRVAVGTDSFCGFGKFGDNTIEEAERSAQAGIGISTPSGGRIEGDMTASTTEPLRQPQLPVTFLTQQRRAAVARRYACSRPLSLLPAQQTKRYPLCAKSQAATAIPAMIARRVLASTTV
jgi:imidazolonepropionase-like amidohydrolase